MISVKHLFVRFEHFALPHGILLSYGELVIFAAMPPSLSFILSFPARRRSPNLVQSVRLFPSSPHSLP